MYEMMKKMDENLFDDTDLRYLQIINNLLNYFNQFVDFKE